MSYITIEDVFITGILRFIIGTYVDSSFAFASWVDKDPNPCEFISTNRTTAHIRTKDLMKRLWSVQHNFMTSCGKKKKLRFRENYHDLELFVFIFPDKLP